ncbi:methyltransferase type 11 [Luminiphilus syltensis NOR5-1B]|uniref:Methyltransferase type 11 n=1 Tax=Luminiphilus syltensis NOR5-1B TaxID=565045 RepID=B8KYC5_9GAMM|nr:class I SAM-dependent methyltransferase [Luminiphilus syltensis]EED35456.1 methyltransferase type 11 [Luminiphilus syltensis NOR5-1B]
MGFYSRELLPRWITCACGAEPMAKQRAKIVPRARGRVLEMGLGAGHNLPYYDANQVTSLVGIDPCETSWKLAAKRVAATPFDVRFIAGSAEDLPIEDASMDTVAFTYTLCTIPDPVAALREAHRVLRPDGQLLFCEHGRAPDASVRRWQDRLNPLWRRIAGGCNLNRDIVEILLESGFRGDDIEHLYLPKTPRFAGFNTWGCVFPAR